MYLGASLCISFLGIFMLGGVTLIDIHVIFIDSCCFVIHCLLIYIYELFIHICLYFVLCESYKNVIPVVLLFSVTHAFMRLLSISGIYRLIQLSCCLHLQLMDSS